MFFINADAFGQAYTCQACGPDNNCNGVAGSSGNCSFAAGEDAEADGNTSISIGYKSVTTANSSLVFGNLLATDGSSQSNMVIGFGIASTTTQLINDMSNTIMIGANSDVSTMFIGNSGGTTGAFGNVGIGDITDPASLLHVRNQIRVGLTSGADGSLVFNNAAGNTITFNTPTSMSTQSYTLPTAVGTVNQVLALTGVSGSVGTLGWVSGGGSTTAWELAGNIDASSSSILGATVPGVPLRIYAGNAERIRVASDGNVGIGTNLPTALLHMSATASCELRMERAAGNSSRIKFAEGGTEIGNFLIDNSGHYKITNLTAAGNLRLQVVKTGGGSPYDAIFIEGDQAFVGVGTSNPDTKFHVKAPASSSITGEKVAYFENMNVGIGTASPQGRLDVNGTVFAALALNTGNNVEITASGQLVENTSTINHKTDVQDLEFDREAFFNLRPVSYRWKEAHGGHQDIGLIAEEVEQIMPNMVNYGYKRTYIDETTGEMLRDSMGVPVADTTQLQPWGVDYRKISIYLLALSKEQDALLNNMADRLNEVESAIENCCSTGPSYRMGSDESGKDNNHGIQLKVYPNPNDGNFTIDYSLEEGKNAKLYLVTTSGQKMLLSDNVRLKGKEDFNISGPSGVYQVTLEDASGGILQTTKIVITR